MAKVIMTSEEYVSRLKVLADRKTFYKNVYPYNLLYIHSDGRTSGDCLNTIKALLNGYDVNKKTVGYYQRDLSNTGDVSEPVLLSMCTEISSDFDNVPKASLLYMRGHVGSFVGLTKRNGKEYNVIECTKSFGGGIVYSWVDTDGTRRSHKGGVKNGKWVQHGLMTKFISYNATEGSNSQGNNKVDVSMLPTLRKGSTGQYVKILQQLLVDKGYDPKGVDGIFGNGCLACVKKYQSENTDVNGKKLVVDGCVGQKTWGSLYK